MKHLAHWSKAPIDSVAGDPWRPAPARQSLELVLQFTHHCLRSGDPLLGRGRGVARVAEGGLGHLEDGPPVREAGRHAVQRQAELGRPAQLVDEPGARRLNDCDAGQGQHVERLREAALAVAGTGDERRCGLLVLGVGEQGLQDLCPRRHADQRAQPELDERRPPHVGRKSHARPPLCPRFDGGEVTLGSPAGVRAGSPAEVAQTDRGEIADVRDAPVDCLGPQPAV